MGCASSKILTRSWSFQEEVKQRLKRRSNGVEELLNSKNGGDQLFALLCTANTVARKIEVPTQSEEPENNSSEQVDHNEGNVNTAPELTDVEIINTWELLAGLDEEKEVEEPHSIHETGDYKFIVSNGSPTLATFNSTSDKGEGRIMRTRSLLTVEEFDAMVAANQQMLEKSSESSIRECSTTSVEAKRDGDKEHVESELKSGGTAADCKEKSDSSESGLARNNGSKRKAMAKELAALKVPSFEFSKIGSLKDWLQRGGQVSSPGSYVTPKFGNFVLPEPKYGDDDRDDDSVFDPDMVAQFEQAMNQLATDEEFALQQIIESLQ